MTRRERIEEAIKGAHVDGARHTVGESMIGDKTIASITDRVLAALEEEAGGGERERFEAWARDALGRLSRCNLPGDDLGDYQDSHTSVAWGAWQAALRGRGEGKP